MLKNYLLLLVIYLCTTAQSPGQCPDSIRVTDTTGSDYKYKIYPSLSNSDLVISNGGLSDTITKPRVFKRDTSIKPSDWTVTQVINKNGTVVFCTVPLPVELIYFQANQVRDQIKLEWETASETNNSHFLVQRLGNVSWLTIARKKGHGTSITSHHYSHVLDKYSGVQYFRLKQVDFDNTEHLSNIIAVKFSKGSPLLPRLNIWSGGIRIKIIGDRKIIELK